MRLCCTSSRDIPNDGCDPYANVIYENPAIFLAQLPEAAPMGMELSLS